ncbi:hypothetical protein EA462_06890 [Natrarchaeobius halalkaliphilus]|uniref:Uncharacterized protein n=1 Tax=Natrarchaeobius halalkaliphilus TaxID=1679091 RepID=A0A3N6MD14_9EURY|nr:hypothetical protein [Natrarchaeobius halalkaliphilus]RQG91666.1 hypothetical protein EA462_06890 [Natrarchaeobius halalkaliphilus]
MHLNDSVTAAGFWLGTLLPVAYLPVFFTGIDSVTMLSVFLGLLAINVLALVVGHEYPASRSQ